MEAVLALLVSTIVFIMEIICVLVNRPQYYNELQMIILLINSTLLLPRATATTLPMRMIHSRVAFIQEELLQAGVQLGGGDSNRLTSFGRPVDFKR